MSVGFVVVPGIGGSGKRHWQTVWEERWGTSARRVSPRSWAAPDLDDWVSAVDAAVRQSAERSHVVLVAHSLGCWAVADWLLRRRPSIAVAAFLVAAPDPAGNAYPVEKAPTFGDLQPHSLPCPSIVLASRDDPYAAPGRSRTIAAAWGAQWQLLGSLGHINADSGVDDWPQGRQLLDRFLSGIGFAP